MRPFLFVSLASLASFASLASLAACTSPPPAQPTPGQAPSATTQAPVNAAPTNKETAAAKLTALPFIEDAYAKALAEARAKKRPLFVDTWAPWCHSCVSMKEFVLTDERLLRMADEFVWLSIDIERGANADFLARFASTGVPTLWVIDPDNEQPALKWLGAATAPELASLLEDAASAVKRGDLGGEAGAALVRGNQASAAGRTEVAISEYRAALKAAPPAWAKRGPVVEALSTRLSEAKKTNECVALATSEMSKIPPSTALANLVVNGSDCAFDLPKGAAQKDAITAFASEARKLATDPSVKILADDRSGLFEHAVAGFKANGDTKEAARLARAWSTFLDDEAKQAKTPAARAVFDPHRLLAYIELGEAERAIPMLTDSERDLPSDYNPPARLARTYLELKRYPEAIAASDRALAKAYGPRKLRIYSVKADALLAKGDKAGAIAALADALAYAGTIPLTGSYPRVREAIAKRHRELGGR